MAAVRRTTSESGKDTHVTDGALNDLFQGILKEFGTSPPQLAVLIGIVIGSFGFAEFFNPGAWTIVSLFCFGLIYALWPAIPPHPLRVVIYAAIFIAVYALI